MSPIAPRSGRRHARLRSSFAADPMLSLPLPLLLLLLLLAASSLDVAHGRSLTPDGKRQRYVCVQMASSSADDGSVGGDDLGVEARSGSPIVLEEAVAPRTVPRATRTRPARPSGANGDNRRSTGGLESRAAVAKPSGGDGRQPPPAGPRVAKTEPRLASRSRQLPGLQYLSQQQLQQSRSGERLFPPPGKQLAQATLTPVPPPSSPPPPPQPSSLPPPDRRSTSTSGTPLEARFNQRAAAVQKSVLDADEIERLFQKTLIKACKTKFPDILSRTPDTTPYRHLNCSVLCVYGQAPITLDDGSICYMQIDFIGTPGRCAHGQCVVSGKPFSYDGRYDDPLAADVDDDDINRSARPPVAPGFTPDTYKPPAAPSKATPTRGRHR